MGRWDSVGAYSAIPELNAKHWHTIGKLITINEF